MKIRIKGNSVRFRLSQSEVIRMKEKGVVSDQINFGDNELTYEIRKTSDSEITASFIKNIISLSIPQNIIKNWLKEEEVGFSREILLNSGKSLSVLVEKDYQCLTERKGEDETDLFANPAQGHGH